MRITLLVMVAALAACTKPNPNTCCVTDAQCAELGADERRPCAAGQACSAHTCVASECTTSPECTAPDAPICINNLCVGSCTIDAECTDVPERPYCGEAGTCVGCTDAAQCPVSAAICDAETRSCRGCELDDECASGVCIEADGVCAVESEIIHVAPTGVDAGECPESAPCATLAYAVQRVTDSRIVVRLTGGGQYPIATIALTRPVIIDGTGTVLHKPAAVPTFTMTYAGQVTIEGVVLGGTTDPNDPSVLVEALTTLRISGASVVEGGIRATNGTVAMSGITVRAPVSCSNGTLTVREVQAQSLIEGSSCQLSVFSSRWDLTGDSMLRASGGLVTIENNLFVQGDELADSINIQGVAPGSRFHFNTVVNTSGVDSDGQALYCDGSLDVSSSIFAYRSRHPHAYQAGCLTKYSLYDDVALALPTPALASQVGSINTFFVSLTGKDFHLAQGSPARGNADPGALVTQDIERLARPSPIGTTPDIGAFEAP